MIYAYTGPTYLIIYIIISITLFDIIIIMYSHIVSAVKSCVRCTQFD